MTWAARRCSRRTRNRCDRWPWTLPPSIPTWTRATRWPRHAAANDTEGRSATMTKPRPRHESSFVDPDEVSACLGAEDYVADDGLAMSVFLALRMGRPLFVEGAPGVGKTLLAQVLSRVFDAPLIRLQCFEGLDIAQAAYEWNYPRQLLELQAKGAGAPLVDDVFTEAFLLKRPLVRAIDAAHERAPVLLIDELDRADEEFESFLLELLSEYQITIPELGTLRAR